MKKTLLLSWLACTACGPIELGNGEQTEETEVVRQAGKTDQGKTDQGKTDQGKTDQGSSSGGVRLVVNRGSWQIRQGSAAPYSYVSVYGGLNNAYGSTGTELWGRTYTTNPTYVAASRSTYFSLQDGSARYDKFLGKTVTNGPPLVYLGAQEVTTSGFSALRAMRIVNTYTDTGWDSAGYRDASNLLVEPYRTQLNGNTGNSDLRFYRVQIQNSTDPTRWDDLCQSSGPGNKAIFMPGYFKADGTYVDTDQQHMGVTCWDGTAAKCMRWGYRHWRNLSHPTKGSISLKPLWLACVRAARADYCGVGQSYTEDFRPIDLWDRYGFITKSGESDQWFDSTGRPDAYSDESAFDMHGAVCLVRERLYQYNFETATCPTFTQFYNGSELCTSVPNPNGTWSSCGPKGAVSTPSNVFDRGSLTTCDQVAIRPPLVYISSYDSGCSLHSPTEQGDALGKDCNCVTKKICNLADPSFMPLGTHPWRNCCAEDANGHLVAGAWDAQCRNKAVELLNWSAIRPVCDLTMTMTTTLSTALVK